MRHAGYLPALKSLMTRKVIPAIAAEAGMVRIQAQTMRPATPQRTADSRCTAPTPTIAQSDCRRRNFSYLCGPLATGKLTSTISSSAASGVVNSPLKKSRAAIDRLLVVIVASSINATVPKTVPQGLEIPLVIAQGGSSTTLSVRVVK